MDALLQIIIPKISNLEKNRDFRIFQPVYNWDGVDYPQGPKILSWFDVGLFFDERMNYPNKFLPPNYVGEDWIWLTTSDKTLDDYEELVNGNIEYEDNNLEMFIRILLKDFDRWVVSFLLQSDQIDNVYQIDVENCIAKLRNNLNRNITKEGFIAYK